MTKAPSQTLPRDVFVDHDVPPAPGASASLAAAVRQINNCHSAQSNRPVLAPSGETPDQIRGHAMNETPPSSASQSIRFQSNTTAPSPPATSDRSGASHVSNSSPDNAPSSQASDPSRLSHITRPDSFGGGSNQGLSRSPLPLQHRASSSSLKPISRTPSLKQAMVQSAGSNCSSPIISAMGEVTPLPSPLLSNHSPGPWKQLRARSSSRESSLPPIMHDSVLVTASGESVAAALAHQSKRKVYAGLNHSQAQEQSSGKYEHTRNRSISEYIPDPRGIPKRHTTVSGPRGKQETVLENADGQMRREPHLSESRGITPAAKPPTPPPSESSQSNDSSSSKTSRPEFFEARGRGDAKLRRWRAIKDLGQGTFSRVVLATSQASTERWDDKESPPGPNSTSQPSRKTLVAVKVCEHGPRGGASENRIEMSLKRELEIMQSISHPSLVHLKAWNIEPTRALLILSYCPGGDLFDIATAYRESLTSGLLRRIFAELVGAVRYLHELHIVHRDIKLESRFKYHSSRLVPVSELNFVQMS